MSYQVTLGGSEGRVRNSALTALTQSNSLTIVRMAVIKKVKATDASKDAQKRTPFLLMGCKLIQLPKEALRSLK